jgi:uncharacterized membrane protein
MLFPELFVRLMGVELVADAGFSYGLRCGAPLMIGWTVLLFWAQREPVARRDILPLTLVVVVGYIIFEVYSVATGTGSPAAALPLLVMQSGMIVLFTIGYRRATDGTTAGAYVPHYKHSLER